MTFTREQLAEALPKAAQHIKEHGLNKGCFFSGGTRDYASHPTNPACVYGAVAIALGVSRYPLDILLNATLTNIFTEALADLYPDLPSRRTADTVDIDDVLSMPKGDVVAFNDNDETTPEQVIELLDHAAKIANTTNTTNTKD